MLDADVLFEERRRMREAKMAWSRWRCRWTMRLTAAALMFGSVLSYAQDEAPALFARGQLMLEATRAEDARQAFEAGLKLQPHNARARYLLGEAYRKLGLLESATEQYRRSAELAGGTELARMSRRRLKELSASEANEGGVEAQVGAASGCERAVCPAPGVRSDDPSAKHQAISPWLRRQRPENWTGTGTEFRDCEVCPVLVVLPTGGFEMNSPPKGPWPESEEHPPRFVTIDKPLLVGKYEVTFDEWGACVREKGCAATHDEGWGRGRRPVINVDFEQAEAYTRWLSKRTGRRYRLLKEDEWEYAARAGSHGKLYFWGDAPDAACQYANVYDVSGKSMHGYRQANFECDDGQPTTAPVGSYQPNAFGLHDMLGNVWEWVDRCLLTVRQAELAWIGSGEERPGRDESRWDCRQRVIRGGSWSNKPEFVRSGQRSIQKDGVRSSRVGFRVVTTAD
jgi:formylglycine-generating enzyme required for sulfatase activity